MNPDHLESDYEEDNAPVTTLTTVPKPNKKPSKWPGKKKATTVTCPTKDELLAEVEDELVCKICFDVDDSIGYGLVQCQNGHIMCQNCFSRVCNECSAQCPICKVALYDDEPARVRSAENALQSLGLHKRECDTQVDIVDRQGKRRKTFHKEDGATTVYKTDENGGGEVAVKTYKDGYVQTTKPSDHDKLTSLLFELRPPDDKRSAGHPTLRYGYAKTKTKVVRFVQRQIYEKRMSDGRFATYKVEKYVRCEDKTGCGIRKLQSVRYSDGTKEIYCTKCIESHLVLKKGLSSDIYYFDGKEDGCGPYEIEYFRRGNQADLLAGPNVSETMCYSPNRNESGLGIKRRAEDGTTVVVPVDERTWNRPGFKPHDCILRNFCSMDRFVEAKTTCFGNKEATLFVQTETPLDYVYSDFEVEPEYGFVYHDMFWTGYRWSEVRDGKFYSERL